MKNYIIFSKKNTNYRLIVALFIALNMSVVYLFVITNRQKLHEVIVKSNREEFLLNKNLRKLWNNNAIWMYKHIISTLERLFDYKQTLNRLLQNQDVLGNSLMQFYDDETCQKIIQLLKNRINLINELIEGLRAISKMKVDQVNKKWQKNSMEIAETFSKINPYFKKESLTIFFNNQFRRLKQLISFRLYKNWADDIKIFDEILEYELNLADMLTQGIIKQFPNKF